MITININKAKEIWKTKLRESRTPVLEKLDVEYMRLHEQGKDTSEIVSKKQQLRDITDHPDLNNAKTAEEIKSFWPDILNNYK
mgnify:CR=1 FL=1